MKPILDFLIFFIPAFALHGASGTVSNSLLSYGYTISFISLALVSSCSFSFMYLIKHYFGLYPPEEINRATYWQKEKPARFKLYSAVWFKVTCIIITIYACLLHFSKNDVLTENYQQFQMTQNQNKALIKEHNRRLTSLESTLAECVLTNDD